jgi:hypothetical protein
LIAQEKRKIEPENPEIYNIARGDPVIVPFIASNPSNSLTISFKVHIFISKMLFTYIQVPTVLHRQYRAAYGSLFAPASLFFRGENRPEPRHQYENKDDKNIKNGAASTQLYNRSGRGVAFFSTKQHLTFFLLLRDLQVTVHANHDKGLKR